MRTRRSTPPWWFLVGVAVACAVLCRGLGSYASSAELSGGHTHPTQLGFLGFLILLGELIWKGLEVAGKITLEILHWMVVNLSLIVTKIGNGLKALGSGLLLGLKKAWDFLELTYDHVLKPAWEKFWRWFDRFRKWLDSTFAPVLKFLRHLRDSLLGFYKSFIRPWLDFIDVTRRVLRVLQSLGLKWAGKLDAELGALEDAIEKPFRALLAKVNEIITLVNRVVTLDGLLQRLALVRSLERDIRYAWRAAVNWRDSPLTDQDRADLRKRASERTRDDVVGDFAAAAEGGGGRYHAVIAEASAQWRIYLSGR